MFRSVTVVILAMVSIINSKVLDDDMLLFWRRSTNYYNPAQPLKNCKPFTTYQEDCNKCVCSADGVPYCTKMACFKAKPPSQVESNMVPLNPMNTVDLTEKNRYN